MDLKLIALPNKMRDSHQKKVPTLWVEAENELAKDFMANFSKARFSKGRENELRTKKDVKVYKT